MCNYEKLLVDAAEDGLTVIEKDFESNAKGLCKGKKIGIRKALSMQDKTCILAEELGHYHTSVGDILDQNDINNQKQEKIARKWAVNKLLKIEKLIDAAKHGCENLFEIAEYLDVTEDFLKESIDIFRQKYGPCYVSENYAVVFNDLGFSVSSILKESPIW